MTQTALFRILDASINRATEGLRAVEDYTRFAIDDPFLTSELKRIRHDFVSAAVAVSSEDRHAARDTQRDVGTGIATASESRRAGLWDVCAANLKRSEQSLRSLEEFGKLVSEDFASQCQLLRYRLYTIEKALDTGRSSRERLENVTLCVLLDACDSAAKFELMVAALVNAGVGMIQLRDKNLDDRHLIERSQTLVSLTRPKPPAPPGVSQATFGRTLAIINDRPDIAAAVRADGVHVGQEDLSVKDVRTIVGPRMLVGVSTHNIAQARTAVLDGADYLGAGPTFSSTTKSFDQFAGLPYLREIANEIRLPTFAIGGINAQNVSEVLATGSSRVAVSAAITAAPNPTSAAQQLLGILQRPKPVAV